MHFHPAALAANQSSFSERTKMLRKRGLRNGPVAHGQKRGAILRAVLADDLGVDRHPYRIGEGVEDALDGDVLLRWMIKRSHNYKTSQSRGMVQ